MRSWFLRLRHFVSGRVRVTIPGLFFTLAILLVGFGAFASANNLLFLLLAAMLSTLMVSGFVSRLGLAGLELDLLVPEHASARRTLAGRVLVINTKRWIPSFSIHIQGTSGARLASDIYLPVIPGGATLEEPVELVFAERGIYDDNSFRCSTRFPFGFTERNVSVKLNREILVYPCVEAAEGFEDLLALIHGEIASPYRGRGSDFYRIRPYEALESARHVDWKATAHTGELQVREFAREQETLVHIYLDLDTSDHEWFEKAVECCAFLSWRVFDRDARLRFQTQNFDARVPEEGDAYTILKYLALVQPARRAVPPALGGENCFQLVFTTSPQRFLDRGWQPACIVDSFAGPAAAAPGARGAGQAAGTGEDVDHRGRTGRG